MPRIGRSRPASNYKVVKPVNPDTFGVGSGGINLAPLAFSGSASVTNTGSGAFSLGALAFSASADVFTPFPAQPLPIRVETLLNGTWTDISLYVQQRSDIAIIHGHPNEGQNVTMASMGLMLNNKNGRFTPKNTSSPYYPYLTRNTQIRVSVQRVAPPTATVSYTGYRFWGEVSSWPPRRDLTGKDAYMPLVAAGVIRRLNQGGVMGTPVSRYISRLAGSSVPLAYWACDDGSGSTSFASGVPGGNTMTWTGTPGLASDTAFDGSGPLPQLNGSVWSGTPAGYMDGGSQSFTTPGTYTWVAPAGVTTLNTKCWGGGSGASGGNGFVDTSTPTYEAVGGFGGGGGEYAGESSNTVVPGSTYTVVVGPGGSGSASSSPDAGGNSTFSGPSATTVTAHGAASGKKNGTGGTGSTNSVHHNGGDGAISFSDSSSSPHNATVAGSGGGSSGGTAAAGNAGAEASGSTPGAGGAAVTGGGAGATGSASGTGAIGSMPGGGGSGGFGQITSGNATAGGNGGNGGAGQVTLGWTPTGGGTTPFANVMRFALDIPVAGGVDGAIWAEMTTSGTIAKVDVVYHTAGGGSLRVIGYNGGGTVKFDTGNVSGYNGSQVVVSIELTPSGSAVAWAAWTESDLIGATPNLLGSGTVASSSIGGMSALHVNVGGTETGAVGVGQFIFQGVVTSLSDFAKAVGGFNGERCGDRFTRLCGEENIGAELVGNAVDTPQMGPQPNKKLVDALQEIEDLDCGHLFESTDQFGMGYRTRVSMQNQAVAATFDYSAAVLAGDLQPDYDDPLIRNSVTVTRNGGSSYLSVDTTSSMSQNAPPNGVGYYPYSRTVNSKSEPAANGEADWLKRLGTVDEYRYPVVTIDLARSAAASVFNAVANLTPASYFQITNPPADLPSGTIKQLAIGWSETLNAFKWTIKLNAVPESPYEGVSLPSW